MRTEPGGNFSEIWFLVVHHDHKICTIVWLCLEMISIHPEKPFCGSPCDPFVAISERVIHAKRLKKRCCHGKNSRIERYSSKCRFGSLDGGVKKGKVPNSCFGASALDNSFVYVIDIINIEKCCLVYALGQFIQEGTVFFKKSVKPCLKFPVCL